ncbi:MAG: GEVED domain-containing protein, partial [Actinomycetota bacterium]
VDFFAVFTANPADPDSSPGNDNGAKTANEDDEAAINLSPSNPADLSIILFSAPASGAAGSSGNVSFTLQNSGSLPASNFKVGIYLSADNQWSANDILVGETTPNLVPPMGSTTGSGSFTIAAGTTPGNYFLILRADKDNQVFESNENNNNASTAFQVTGTGGGTYCASSSSFPWEEWIAKVELGNLSNASAKSNYSNFTNLTANLTTGQSYLINLTTGFSYFTWDEYWRVWIDFNRDGVFSTPDEVVQQRILTAPAPGTATATVTGSVNIPSSALTGTTRMRVSMKRGGYASACETLPFGEVEDYTVNISNGGGACSILFAVSNVACQDNGTPTHPLADQFTVSILVRGPTTGAPWQMSWRGGSTTGRSGVSN